MSKQIEIITDMPKLGAAITAASKMHARVDATWQVLAVSAIGAFAEHGNVFYVNHVYRSLGKGARHKAMTEFFIAFGGVQANTGESKDETPFIKDASKKADLQGATENNWFDMSTSPKPDEVLDYLKLALKVVKKSPKDGQETVHGELRVALATLLDTYAEQNGIEGVKLPKVGEPEAPSTEGHADNALAGIAA